MSRLTHLPNFARESLVDRDGKARYPSITTFLEGLWNRGMWTPVRFDAADFTANGAMTWTLVSGDVTSFTYTLIGRTLLVSFVLEATSVGGVPDTALLITIPGGFVASGYMRNPVLCYDNGAFVPAFAAVLDGSTAIVIQRADAAVWTASVNNTYVSGQIAFEVQG